MNAQIAAFVRAFQQTPETLCSEVVVAWLRTKSLAPCVTERRQAATKAALGTDGGIEAIAAEVGALEIAAAEVQANDVVLVPCANGNRVLGLHLGGGISIMAGFGKVHTGRFKIARAWRLPA